MLKIRTVVDEKPDISLLCPFLQKEAENLYMLKNQRLTSEG